MLAKYCCEVGMRGTNTFFQHRVGSPMIRAKPTRSTLWQIKTKARNEKENGGKTFEQCCEMGASW